MSIEKINMKHNRHENKSFTTIYNSVLQNISNAFALGVYCYLSSLPHDWIVSKQQLMKHFGVGKDKIVSIMAWLNKNKLIEYVQERKEDGKMGAHTILVKNGSEFLEENTANLNSRLLDFPISGGSSPTKEIYNTNKITNKNKTDTKPEKQASSNDFVLPDWLNKEVWDEFKKYRKEIRKPLTSIAEKKAINTLTKLRESGQDPSEVITNSIINGWSGLFPLKEANKNAIKTNLKTVETRSTVKEWVGTGSTYNRQKTASPLLQDWMNKTVKK